MLYWPIGARLGRETAHVYRQHSAGRGTGSWESAPDRIPKILDLESLYAVISMDFAWLNGAALSHIIYMLIICRVDILFVVFFIRVRSPLV